MKLVFFSFLNEDVLEETQQWNAALQVRSVPARVANRPDAGEPSKARCSQPPTTRCQSPNPKHKMVDWPQSQLSSEGGKKEKKEEPLLLLNTEKSEKS